MLHAKRKMVCLVSLCNYNPTQIAEILREFIQRKRICTCGEIQRYFEIKLRKMSHRKKLEVSTMQRPAKMAVLLKIMHWTHQDGGCLEEKCGL